MRSAPSRLIGSGEKEKASAAAEAFSALGSGYFAAAVSVLAAAALKASDWANLLTEAVYASGSVDQLLLAGEEGVTGRADFQHDVAFVGGARLEVGAAGALDVDGVVTGVNSFFGHGAWILSYLFMRRVCAG